MTQLGRTEIESRLPHRFENLLLDTVVCVDESRCLGNLSLMIDSDDALGRDIFLRSLSADDLQIVPETFLEILALGSIVAAGGIDEDSVLFFAGISKFTYHSPIRAGETLQGTVEKMGQKGPFVQFCGTITSADGRAVASGELKAFFSKKSELNESSKDEENPPLPFSLDLERRSVSSDTSIKASALCCVDEILLGLEDAATAVGTYTLPLDHPFNKGHFPGMPVMMGIMQMMGVSDTIAAYHNAGLLLDTKQYGVSCDATVYRTDGSLVAKIKGVTLKIDQAEKEAFVDCVSVQKVMFKQRVSPGDTIYYYLSNINTDSV